MLRRNVQFGEIVHRYLSLQRQERSEIVALLVQYVAGIRALRMCAKHGRRPGEIVGVTCNVMNVQLRHHVAQGGDIHFIGLEVSRHEAGDVAGLVDELGLFIGVELKNFAQAWALWDENQPRIVGIVHQEHAAELELAKLECVGGEARVEFKLGHGDVGSDNEGRDESTRMKAHCDLKITEENSADF